MARFKQVTRTIAYTVADVMCVNIETSEVSTQTVTVSGEMENNDKLLVAASKLIPDNLKAVAIKSAVQGEDTYCMPEEKFMEWSMVLPKGKKSLKRSDFEKFYKEQFEGEDEPETE